jgi:hypothetical protein
MDVPKYMQTVPYERSRWQGDSLPNARVCLVVLMVHDCDTTFGSLIDDYQRVHGMRV